jgi:hypothetical protein
MSICKHRLSFTLAAVLAVVIVTPVHAAAPDTGAGAAALSQVRAAEDHLKSACEDWIAHGSYGQDNYIETRGLCQTAENPTGQADTTFLAGTALGTITLLLLVTALGIVAASIRQLFAWRPSRRVTPTT